MTERRAGYLLSISYAFQAFERFGSNNKSLCLRFAVFLPVSLRTVTPSLGSLQGLWSVNTVVLNGL